MNKPFENRLTTPRIYLMCTMIFLLAHGFFLSSQFYHNAYDDAYISFRYAKNVVAGNGLVYNPGERVEGYTNFLWIILLTFFARIGCNMVTVSKVLGFLFSMVTMILVFFFSRKYLRIDLRLTLVPLSLLALDSSFASSAISGMETALFTFLVTAGAFAYIHESNKEKVFPYSSLLFAGASLTRPEGLLIWGMTILHRIVHGILTSHVGWLKKSLKSLLVVIFVYVPYFLWRYNYYEYLFPNTFYAKTGGGWMQVQRGLEYLGHFLEARIGALCLGLAILSLLKRQFDFLVSYFLFVLISFTFYIVCIGGDWPIAHRFFVPLLPLIYLLISLGLKTFYLPIPSVLPLRTGIWRFGKTMLLICLVLSTLVTTSYAGEYRLLILHFKNIDKCRISMGKWLRENVSPEAKIAVFAAGELPFYSELKTIDMLGMTDSKIAHLGIKDIGEGISGHEKFDATYSLSKEPDYIAFIASCLDSSGFPDLSKASAYERELLTNSGFIKSYRLLRHQYCSDRDAPVGVLFVRGEGVHFKNPE